jgi:hypothetical protein
MIKKQPDDSKLRIVIFALLEAMIGSGGQSKSLRKQE